MRGADLLAVLLVAPAVEAHQHQLHEIGARAEELHLLTHPHRRDTAGDRVIVAVDRPHEVVVLVLYRVGIAGDLRRETFKGLRQRRRPQHREIRFGGRPQIIEGVEHTVGIFRHQSTPVLANAAKGLRYPHRIARKELVILRRTQMTRHAQLHHKIIHDLLRAALVKQSPRQVTLEINIEEGRNAPDGHRRAVLLLDRAEIGEIEPLYGLAGVRRRLGDVEAVKGGHLLELAEEIYLLIKLLKQPDVILQHHARSRDARLVSLLFFYKAVHAVKRDAAVIADDAPAPVRIGQPRNNAAVSRRLDLIGIDTEYAVVMRRAVLKLPLHLIRQRIAVGFAGLARHRDAAEGVNAAAQRPVCLQADDDLPLLIQISGTVICQ